MLYDSALRRGAASASQIHASLANHSCSARQIGQNTRAKNTGVAAKLSGSVTMPVGMSRPVSGHLTITVPIGLSCCLSFGHVICAACENRLTQRRPCGDAIAANGIVMIDAPELANMLLEPLGDTAVGDIRRYSHAHRPLRFRAAA